MKKLTLLLLLLLSLTAWAQRSNRTITGTVYDESKQPLPGVNIIAQGTRTGCITDSAGHYRLLLTQNVKKLTFLFIGFQSQTIAVGKKERIDIYLKADTNSLNEVVVVGYGTQQKVSLTGSIATLPGMQVNGITKALPGRAHSISANGSPGAASNLTIRGIASTNSKQPLYIVDGVPVNNIAGIKPKHIKSINVVKDASATALYGSRATNGVIIVTTKNSKAKSKQAVVPNPGYFTQLDLTDESYAPLVENTFQNPKDNPLSTFSVDVDAASYSNIRRYINNGQLPPKDAIRIEEMVNYFGYNYPAPTNNEPVAIHTELAAAPWNPQHRLLRVGLKAKVVATEKLPASNLVFLIDVSGSMNAYNKLPLVQSSLKMLVDQLRPQDKVAIVVYAGAAGLVLPATPGDQKTTIKDAIDRLSAGGSTAGGQGIKLAYEVAKNNFIKAGNNRVVLATDGDFNVGASSDQDMQHLIEQERKSGIFLSVLGFGMGNYKDSKMETLADKGNGNYAYIDNITEARKTLVSEFGGTLFTVAKDVKLQLEFNGAKVQAYRLIGYENRLLNKEDFNNDLKDAGDMGAGHTVTAFYEIIPTGVKDNFTTSVDPLKYQKTDKSAITNSSSEMMTIKFRYKEPTSSQSKLSQAIVMDRPKTFETTSADFRFAAAVAEVGLLLRESDYKQKATFKQAIDIARAAKGEDKEGYQAEFIKLAESARLLSKNELAANN
ncbi:von Willebrand factor type A domain-containing protein [Mucilaginibacter sp. Bleaf8]|uniref:VWA domain-containing protein n=1 Tax=Mucilaginibacter sp. Bleaf8 TaxID=2834430 RepID=UPI001BD15235|nr:VWA domain-containing protein [Mucilaginibacter sp. Bleaf8]MBS7566196.1 von Willebrand factor type A domain-containing protein [Mucilaginibacter sp. Bleaf8]